MTLTEQRITGLRAKGIVVRADCNCGLCFWARGGEPRDRPAKALAARRVAKPRKQKRKS